MAQTPTRSGKFAKVGENLYRYSASEIYYAMFRRNGKLTWKSLKTKAREFANRKLREEVKRADCIDVRLENTTLTGLLDLYQSKLFSYDTKTRPGRLMCP